MSPALLLCCSNRSVATTLTAFFVNRSLDSNESRSLFTFYFGSSLKFVIIFPTDIQTLFQFQRVFALDPTDFSICFVWHRLREKHFNQLANKQRQRENYTPVPTVFPTLTHNYSLRFSNFNRISSWQLFTWQPVSLFCNFVFFFVFFFFR